MKIYIHTTRSVVSARTSQRQILASCSYHGRDGYGDAVNVITSQLLQRFNDFDLVKMNNITGAGEVAIYRYGVLTAVANI